MAKIIQFNPRIKYKSKLNNNSIYVNYLLERNELIKEYHEYCSIILSKIEYAIFLNKTIEDRMLSYKMWLHKALNERPSLKERIEDEISHKPLFG